MCGRWEAAEQVKRRLPGHCGAIERIGRPAVLKTRRFGYDGKGQVAIKNGTDAPASMSSAPTTVAP